jgi:CHRD domain-containing protein
MRRDKVLMLMAALMLPAAAAYAKPTTFTVSLTPGLEVPPATSTATGSATIVLDSAASTLSVHVTFSGLTSGTTASHIHCCLSFQFQTGNNVIVATTTPTFPGFPLGVTSGAYDHVLDLTSASSYNPAFVTAQGGTVAKAKAALISGIQNGETYLNIHTTNFPGGEIRGFLVASPTSAQISLLKTIPINGTAGNPANKMFSFDISFVDPATGLYYLGDRSNAALDVVDTKTDTLFGQIGANPGFQPGFAGDTGSTDTSGPNGVVAASPCVFATDGPSRVVSFNTSVSFTALVSSFNTGGAKRADELAFDPKDRLLLVINNADDPPFGTLINVSTSCVLSQPKTIFFTAANGVNATNGAEQPVWDPNTQRFYVSIPQIGPNVQNGGVIRINPIGGAIEAVYPVNFMQPAGLTAGPNGDLLAGANSVFDTSGDRCSTVLPSETGEGTATEVEPHPATCTGIAAPQSAICNPGRGCTGNALVAIPGVGGGDEVWYNSGDGNYYVTAGNHPVGPVFGVIGSVVNTLTQLVPTLPPVPAVTTGANRHGAGTVHSIAASAANNHVYVPLPANTSYPNCTQGCIAVFGVP